MDDLEYQKKLAKVLIDLPNADWRRFICIEPLIASHPILLQPTKKWAGHLTIQVRKMDDKL
ncbi:D-hexose-6-phosphate mutarotase [Polynucleobacter sphagniphilus]|nr:D-hexose-6-phosphate mutarotase [Polynucleobacter sphagniphilus]